MTRYILIMLIGLALIAAGVVLLTQCTAPPPVVVTPVVVTSTATATATMPSKPSISPSVTIIPPTATVTPELPTMTPTAQVPTATPATPAPTIALLGSHVVKRGETMYGIALTWEPRRFFLFGRDVWEPVCRINPQIADCRMIFVGDVLRIPRR